MLVEVHVLFTNALKIEYKNCCFVILYEMLLHVHGVLKLKTLTVMLFNKVDVLIDFSTLKA